MTLELARIAKIVNNVHPFVKSNSTDTVQEDETFTVPLFVVILVAFGLLVVVAYLYCFFCVPSTNKRKIYAMMKEAKLEDEGHV